MALAATHPSLAQGQGIDGGERGQNYAGYSNGMEFWAEAGTKGELRRFLQKPYEPKEVINGYEPSISQVEWFLSSGTLHIRTPRLLPESNYTIQTPSGSMRLSGGGLYIVRIEGDTSRFTVLKGGARVRNGPGDTQGSVIGEEEEAVTRADAAGAPEVRGLDEEVASAAYPTVKAALDRGPIFFAVGGPGRYEFGRAGRHSVRPPEATAVAGPEVKVLRGEVDDGTVATGNRESLGVALPNRVGLWVESNSDLRFRSYLQNRGRARFNIDQRSRSDLTIERGTVAVWVPRLHEGSATEISTPSASLEVGYLTRCIVVVEEGATRVVVFNGWVTVTPRDARTPLTIRGGERIVMRGGAPATARAQRMRQWERDEYRPLAWRASEVSETVFADPAVQREYGRARSPEAGVAGAADGLSPGGIDAFDDNSAVQSATAGPLRRFAASPLGYCFFTLVAGMVGLLLLRFSDPRKRVVRALFGGPWRLMAVSVIVAVVTGYLSMRQRALFEWEHVGFILGVCLLAQWLEQRAPKARWLQRLKTLVIVFAYLVAATMQIGAMYALTAGFAALDHPGLLEHAMQWMLGPIATSPLEEIFGSAGPSTAGTAAFGAILTVLILGAGILLLPRRGSAPPYRRWHWLNFVLVVSLLLLRLGLEVSLLQDAYTHAPSEKTEAAFALACGAGLLLAISFVIAARHGRARRAALPVPAAVSAPAVVKLISTLAVTATAVTVAGVIASTKDHAAGSLAELRNAYVSDYVKARWDKFKDAGKNISAADGKEAGYDIFPRREGYLYKESTVAVLKKIGPETVNAILAESRPAWISHVTMRAGDGIIEITEAVGARQWNGRAVFSADDPADGSFNRTRTVIDALGGNEEGIIEDVDKSFVKLQHSLLERKLTIPLINIDVSNAIASGVTFLLMCCLSLMLCDQIRLLARIRDASMEEEGFLLLAGVTPLSRAFRGVWALLLALSPLVLFTQTLRGINLQFETYAGELSAPDSLLFHALILGGTLLLTLTTVVFVRSYLQLSRAYRQSMRAVVEKSARAAGVEAPAAAPGGESR